MRYLLSIFALIYSISLLAVTDKYRLTFRDDPSTTMVVCFDVINGSGHTVYYGTTPHGGAVGDYTFQKSVDRQVNYRGMNNNFVRLSGLTPGTRYYFVVADDNSTSEMMYFETVSNDPNATISFIAGGDSRKSSSASDDAIIWGNRMVAKLKPDAVLFGGDMTNGDTDAEWIAYFNAWQETKGPDGRMTPICAAQGNHEATPGVIVNLFDVPDQDNTLTGNQAYYALTFGDNLVRSYTLNSDDLGTVPEQGKWLENDLQQTTATWKIAQYHQPIIPHQSGKPDRADLYDMWVPHFYNYGVRLAVECDAHVVKETKPVRPTGILGDAQDGFIEDTEAGITFVGEGTWRALRTNDDNHPFTRASASFNQVKWIIVNRERIELRTVKTANEASVAAVNGNNRFTPPSGLDVWDNRVTLLENPLNTNPIIKITSPRKGQNIPETGASEIKVDASSVNSTISKVEFIIDGNLVGATFGAPHVFNFNFSEEKEYQIKAIAYDLEDNTSTDSLTIRVGPVDLVVLVDFDDVDLQFTGFGGSNFNEVDNPHNNALNPSSRVGKTTKGFETWAGIFSQTFPNSFDFSQTPIIKVQVYAPRTAILLVKLEDAIDQNIFYELSVPITVTNEWTEVFLDFSDAPENLYEKLTLFFDFGENHQDTYYFDNLHLVPKSIDCQGILEGNAFIDSCGTCAGGNTGITPETDPNQCMITGSNDFDEISFESYPNPFISNVRFDNLPINSQLRISNISGLEVISQKVNSNSFELKTGDWPPGVFIVEINSTNGRIVKQILKE